MPGFIDEYLVKLGFSTDQTGLNRFQNAMREAKGVVTTNLGDMARAVLRTETEIGAGFAAIGTAAIGMADKVAMADQNFRLFALHMYMSKDTARSLKVAMDALGEPLENLTWDAELRKRTQQLIEDQRRMAPGGNFDAQMLKLRDIRFEFTRMRVEAEYGMFNVVQAFMNALGTGPDQLLSKLRQFNEWIISHMPQISQAIAQWFLPIWRDVVDVGKSALQVFEDFGLLFTNIVGLLSGNSALEGTTFSFAKMATAVQTLVHWLAIAFELIAKIVGTLTGVVGGGGLGGLIGSVVGGIAGIPGGPAGIAAGIVGGGATGTAIGAGVGGVGGAAFDLWRAYAHGAGSSSLSTTSSGGASLASLVNGIIYQESRGRQSARSRAGAIGLMQLMPSTAAQLGVNPYDAAQNVAGGTAYFKQLLSRYGGNVPDALAAYNAGPGRVDRVLSGKAALPAETRDYVSRVMGYAGASGAVHVGSVVINITQPNASPAEVQARVTAGMQEAAGKRVQRNLAQFGSYGWATGG